MPMMFHGGLLAGTERWFEYKNSAGQIRVKIRRQTPVETDRVREKYGIEDRLRPGRFDTDGWLSHLAENVLQDWEGVTEADGTATLATVPNRLAALRSSQDFLVFVTRNMVDEDAFRGEGNGVPVSSISGVPSSAAADLAPSAI